MKKIILLIFSLFFVILTHTLVVSASDSQKQTITITTEIPYKHTITILNSGNGTIVTNNLSIRDTNSITCQRHSNLELIFSADDGYKLSHVLLNDTDITSSINSNSFIIKDITMDYTLNVTFEKVPIQEDSTTIPIRKIDSIYSLINKGYNFINGINDEYNIGTSNNDISNYLKTGDTLSKCFILIGLCILCILIFVKSKKK